MLLLEGAIVEEYFSIAELAIVGSFVLALATGIHTLLSAIQGIATIIKDFIVSRRKSDVLVKPTPDEIIRYSIKIIIQKTVIHDHCMKRELMSGNLI